MEDLEILEASGTIETKAGRGIVGSLKSIDISANLKLVVLNVSGNNLEKIDVSQNTSLTSLDASGNEISSIDLSNNASLVTVDVSYNQLTQIDFSKNSVLTSIDVSNNMLTTIDVSENPNLVSLDISQNNIVTLDLSGNQNVTDVDCTGNENLEEIIVPPGTDIVINTDTDAPVEIVQDIRVSDVKLDHTAITLLEGDVFTLKATVSPDNAMDKSIAWSSSDEKIVSVVDGKVKAQTAGKSTVTVTTVDGAKTAKCEVTVNPRIVSVAGVSLDRTSMDLVVGDTYTLSATVNPGDATNKNVIWKSDNQSVATVMDGVVTAVDEGSATITVTTEDGGKTASCSVTVSPKVIPVTSVSLDKENSELHVGDVMTLVASINPEDATNRNIMWSTSDEAVATVKDGVVTAVNAGNVVITVTTEDGGKTASCVVTVTSPVSGVSLDRAAVNMVIGDVIQLHATVSPKTASNRNVSWNSSNEKVVTVKDGLIKAVAEGDATVTVTTEQGKLSAACAVHVSKTTGTGDNWKRD